MLTVEDFKTKALEFWQAKQKQCLEENGLNPQVMVFAYGTVARLAIPQSALVKAVSPLDPILWMLKQVPTNAAVVVCESWGVQSVKDPEDAKFARDLAQAHRLQYHPNRVERLTAMLVHPDFAELRGREMIRAGKSESDKLIALGVEEEVLTTAGHPDAKMDGRFAVMQKLLVRE